VASLYALIELQNNKRREFEEVQELKNREQKQKEQEWQYAFEEKKRSEEFAWKQKKEEGERKWNEEIAKKTSLLNDREVVLSHQEQSMILLAQENTELKEIIDTLPAKVETAITNQLQKEFDIEKRFLTKEREMQE
jgi:membrane protein involved in colicin uptake